MNSIKFTFKDIIQGFRNLKDTVMAMTIGSFLGFFVGILPAAGATPAALMSYGITKQLSKNSKDLSFPFSDASIMNDIIYVSGQVGTYAGTKEIVEGGIGNETTQALKNINSILEELGSSSHKIFKCLCMLNEIEDYGKMNEAYVNFFNERKNLPSRSTFGARIALEGKIEIECWAVK